MADEGLSGIAPPLRAADTANARSAAAFPGRDASGLPATVLSVRPAQASDIPLLPDIERSSGELFRRSPGLEWIADDDVQSEAEHRILLAEGFGFVAEQPGLGIVGFLNGGAMAGALHIWQMAVRRDQHGRGIGRELIAAAQRFAADRGIGALTLTTFRDVPWNRPYYERLGFVTLGPDDLGAQLKAVLDAEERRGLLATQRCAMRKLLGTVAAA